MTAEELYDILANEKVTRYGGTITITGTDGSVIRKEPLAKEFERGQGTSR